MDHLCFLCLVFLMLSRLFIAALWSSTGKELTCWLLVEMNTSGLLWLHDCYDIKPVRKEEGKSYWKIPLCDDDATREK